MRSSFSTRDQGVKDVGPQEKVEDGPEVDPLEAIRSAWLVASRPLPVDDDPTWSNGGVEGEPD
jgi:hypothetical protein